MIISKINIATNQVYYFTNTDRLMYEIKTEDVYEDFSIDKEMYDFSYYLTRSKCFDDLNKLVLGKMKDETGGVEIKEFVALKPRVYSVFIDDNSELEKENSVNINIVEKDSQ